MRIGGKVEVFTRRSVSGWLAVFGESDERPRLELLLDGISVASATAEEFRQDVATKDLGDGMCQFQITLPEALTDEEADRLRLRIVGSEVLLELPRPALHDPNRALATAITMASPVFIVGSPRSGTSALTRALTAAGYHGFEEGNLLGLSQIVEQQVDWYFEANDATSPGTLLGNVNQTALKARFFAVFKQILDRLNPQEPWFDKTGNPETIMMLPRVMQAWPNSCVIFARRRGIENVISRLAKFPERDFTYHCQDWANNMRAWRTTSERLDQARILEVDQRQMLETPEIVGSKLGKLLGLTELRTERPQENFPGSASRSTRISESGWSGEEIELFQAICGEEMVWYGYEDL
jgi:Sulfotransferase family